jgi:hypothetical protein
VVPVFRLCAGHPGIDAVEARDEPGGTDELAEVWWYSQLQIEVYRRLPGVSAPARHGGGVVIARGVCRCVHQRGLRNAAAGVQLEVICRRWAVAFARFVVAQAGQLVAPADAIAIAGLGSRLDGDERHTKGIVLFRRVACKSRRDWVS